MPNSSQINTNISWTHKNTLNLTLDKRNIHWNYSKISCLRLNLENFQKFHVFKRLTTQLGSLWKDRCLHTLQNIITSKERIRQYLSTFQICILWPRNLTLEIHPTDITASVWNYICTKWLIKALFRMAKH